MAVVGGLNGGRRNLGRRGEKRHGAVSTNDLSGPFTYFQTLERRADGRNGQGVDGSPPH